MKQRILKQIWKLIEWNRNKTPVNKISSLKEKILEPVFFELEWINESFSTDSKRAKIYFSPFDLPKNSFDSGLVAVLLISCGKKFH